MFYPCHVILISFLWQNVLYSFNMSSIQWFSNFLLIIPIFIIIIVIVTPCTRHEARMQLLECTSFISWHWVQYFTWKNDSDLNIMGWAQVLFPNKLKNLLPKIVKFLWEELIIQSNCKCIITNSILAALSTQFKIKKSVI